MTTLAGFKRHNRDSKHRVTPPGEVKTAQQQSFNKELPVINYYNVFLFCLIY